MSTTLRFRDFDIHPEKRRLFVRGREALIGARAYDLLIALHDRKDRVVSKHELFDVVWPKVVVEDNNLPVHIHALRKLLGPTAISTVPGRGYRFTAEGTDDPGAGGRTAGSNIHKADEPKSPEGPESGGPGNLPGLEPEIFGRGEDIASVGRLLSEERLVTISGAGGIGKTRLAQAVAHVVRDRYPHGVWMIELAWAKDAELLISLVAQVLHVTLAGAKEPVEELADALRSQKVLIVLDNCEHLLDAVGLIAIRLLTRAPFVTLLVTSQELLRVGGEHVYKLAPLAVPANRELKHAGEFGSVRLFAARAAALDRGFKLDRNNVGTVVDICASLDGIALAIELAAARVPMLGVFGIQDRLSERFRVLTGGDRVSLKRHQTLRAALDWSHHLLSEEEQKVFRRLGLFSGGFVVEGAQLVAADDELDGWAVLDHLSGLVDKSLVLVDSGERPRYRLLESSRAYAMERLAEAGETDALLRRHAQATADLCVQATRQRNMAWLWDEMNNVRAAYRWAIMSAGDPLLAVSFATHSAMTLAVHGLVSEALQRLIEVEPLVNDTVPARLAAQYWQWLGRCGIEGRLPTSRCVAVLRRAEAMFRAQGNGRHLHGCLRMCAEAWLASGDLEAAKAALEQAEQMEGPAWPVADRMRRTRIQALLLAASGEAERAVELCSWALELAEAAGLERYVHILMADLAAMQLSMGRAADSAEQFKALADLTRNGRSQGLTHAQALAGLIAALVAQKLFGEASDLCVEAVPLLRRSGIFVAYSDIFSWLLAGKGELQLAARLAGAADQFLVASETARNAVKLRARAEVEKLLEAKSSPARTHLSLAEGATSSEEELAQIVAAAAKAAWTTTETSKSRSRRHTRVMTRPR